MKSHQDHLILLNSMYYNQEIILLANTHGHSHGTKVTIAQFLEDLQTAI